MSNFIFDKKIIKISILGQVFELEDNKNLNSKLVNFGEKMQDKANKIKATDDYNKVQNELCNDCYKFLNELLGQGVSNKIFKDREKNIEDCMDLIYFIKQEIEKQKENRMNRYSKERISRPHDFQKKRR